MLVAIPSMSRAATHMDRLFLHKVPSKWQDASVLFVPASQHKAYGQAVPNFKVAAIPDKVKGIIRTRRWIAEWAKKNRFDKFVMCDDDLIFHTRINKDDYHLRKSTEKQLGGMFEWIEKSLDKYAQVGISAREGNNRVGIGTVAGLTHENTRLLRVYAYQTDLFLQACQPKKLPDTFTMDDFHVTLTLLRSGYSNCQTYWWANGQRYTQDVGGASDYRTYATHEASAKLLAEMHPGFVRLHQKADKSKFGTRTEVVISWRKAYAQGQTNAALRRPE